MLTLMIHIQHMGTTIPIMQPLLPVSPLPICAQGQIKWLRISNGKAQDGAFMNVDMAPVGSDGPPQGKCSADEASDRNLLPLA